LCAGKPGARPNWHRAIKRFLKNERRGMVPIWKDIFFRGPAERHMSLEVKWRAATWIYDSPSQGEGMDSKTLS